MNIFQNYKATRYYLQILDSLDVNKRKEFSAMVRAKFFDKVTSDVELEDYLITEEDLDKIEDKINK